MAAYIDYLSAKLDEADDRPAMLADLRNEQLVSIVERLHGMEQFVVMTMNYRQTGQLCTDDLTNVILTLYQNTDRFIDIQVVCYIVVMCLDDLQLIHTQVSQVVHTLTATDYHLPKKHEHCH